MKKLFKKLVIVATIVSLFTIQFNTIYTSATIKNIPQNGFRAWPGRPGGNGDGSDEYMNGLKYGEMRGPWKYIETSRGTIQNLYYRSEINGSIASVILGISSSIFSLGATLPWGVSLGIVITSGAFGIIDTVKNHKSYPGSTYTATLYGSGRRLKTVYVFFDGEGYEISRYSIELPY